MINKLIIIVFVMFLTSCYDKKGTDHNMVDILEIKNIYNYVKNYYTDKSKLPTADEIVYDTDNLYFTDMKRSPQFTNFKGYIYYLDKDFNIKSNKKLIFSMYKNNEGKYNVILSNGDLISVLELPKVQDSYFHLTKKESVVFERQGKR